MTLRITTRISAILPFASVLLFLTPTLVLGQKILTEGAKDLATQIKVSVAKEQKTKVAVLPFRELSGQATVLGVYLAEELATQLFAFGDLEIIERTMLDKVLEELKLAETGLIDPATAKQVGKFVGVEAGGYWNYHRFAIVGSSELSPYRYDDGSRFCGRPD